MTYDRYSSNSYRKIPVKHSEAYGNYIVFLTHGKWGSANGCTQWNKPIGLILIEKIDKLFKKNHNGVVMSKKIYQTCRRKVEHLLRDFVCFQHWERMSVDGTLMPMTKW